VIPSVALGAPGPSSPSPWGTPATGGPSGGSPPPEGLAAPLLTRLSDLRRHSIDEHRPDVEEAQQVHQQQHVKAALIAQQQQQQPRQESDGGTLRALVFGGINTLVGLPALIAFATIVFQVLNLANLNVLTWIPGSFHLSKKNTFVLTRAQAPMYGPYIGSLCKFFFFSSAVHQIVFCLSSSLPFAVG